MKSSRDSKPKPSPTSSPRVTALGILRDELAVAEPNAPISVQQARVLINSLINLQNVVVRVMDTMDANQAIANKNNQNISQNFLDLFNCCKTIGEAVGIEIHGANEEVVGKADDTEVPPGTVKH